MKRLTFDYKGLTMPRFVCCLGLTVLSLASQSFGQRLHDRSWGKYFGAYGCEVSGSQTGSDCGSLHVWHVSYGYYGRTVITGKNVALAVNADSPTSLGNWRGTLYIDSTAYDNQAAALEALFRRELADYFGDSGLQVKVQPIEFAVDQGVYYLRIGKAGKHRIANADIAAKAFAWWSTPRADAVPIDTKKLDRCSPVITGEAPDFIDADLHVGRVLANWHKGEGATWDKSGGTAILASFEFRGEAYPDRGR